MAIRIPADITIVTLQNGSQTQAQRWTNNHASAVLRNASALLKARADIEFLPGSCEQVTEQMPTGANADMVDLAGYHFLAAVHKARNGVRILLVDRLASPELGGQARHQTRVCIVAYGANVETTGRILAHELAHLLELPHIDAARRSGPGQERQAAVWARNLMSSGALNPAAELTPGQVRLARGSALARRFGGP